MDHDGKVRKTSPVGIFMDGGLTQQAQIFCPLSIILSQGSNKALENRLQKDIVIYRRKSQGSPNELPLT